MQITNANFNLKTYLFTLSMIILYIIRLRICMIYYSITIIEYFNNSTIIII